MVAGKIFLVRPLFLFLSPILTISVFSFCSRYTGLLADQKVYSTSSATMRLTRVHMCAEIALKPVKSALVSDYSMVQLKLAGYLSTSFL